MDLPAALAAAKPGDTLRVPAGRYAVNLRIDKAITLLGVGQVVLDGQHRGSVVRVACPGGVARLSGITLVGGTADEAGGGVCLDDGELELTDCTLRFNKAPQYGGGGLFVGGGKARVARCRVEANTGRQGGGVLVDGTGELVLRDSTVIQNAALDGGGVRVKDAGRVVLLGCTVADNKVLGEAARGGALSLSATTTRAPSVEVRQSIISERSQGPACIANEPPGTLTLVRSLLPPWCAALGGDALYAEAGFAGTGAEPYLLAPSSPACERGDAADFGPDAKDLRGEPRGPRPSLGAFASTAGAGSTLPY